ncbi:MAG TPA: hypothetical protein VNC50_05610, partial [Planctomycetia bacterium]|nr:hypothetical protein [Planctomycetia bacterium]
MYRWLRRCMVHAFALGVFGAAAIAIWFCRFYSDSGVVANLIQTNLARRFPNSKVDFRSAKVQPLAGVTISHFKFGQRDVDGIDRDVFRYEELNAQPDADGILSGRLRLKKLAIVRPTLHLHRGKDGAWILPSGAGGGKPLRFGEPMTIALKEGTIVLSCDVGKVPKIEIRNVEGAVHLTPPATIAVEAKGRTDLLPEVSIKAKADLAANKLTLEEFRTGAADVAKLLPLVPPEQLAKLPNPESWK